MLFKMCTKCRTEWKSRDEFLNSYDIELLGYQADCDQVTEGILLFNHNVPGCESSFGIKMRYFIDLYPGKIASGKKDSAGACRKICLNISESARCEANCDQHFVAEIASIIRNWKRPARAKSEHVSGRDSM